MSSATDLDEIVQVFVTYFFQLRWVFYANRARAACLFWLTATMCEQLGRYSQQFLFFSLALSIFSFHVFTLLFMHKEGVITRLYLFVGSVIHLILLFFKNRLTFSFQLYIYRSARGFNILYRFINI